MTRRVIAIAVVAALAGASRPATSQLNGGAAGRSLTFART